MPRLAIHGQLYFCLLLLNVGTIVSSASWLGLAEGDKEDLTSGAKLLLLLLNCF